MNGPMYVAKKSPRGWSIVTQNGYTVCVVPFERSQRSAELIADALNAAGLQHEIGELIDARQPVGAA